MSAADFKPFDVVAPYWGDAAAAPAPALYCQGADARRQHLVGTESGGSLPLSVEPAPSADVTDATDVPAGSWQAGVAELLARNRPVWASRDRWGRLRSALIVARDKWAPVALEAGWTPLEVFGANPDPRAGRVDRDGLITSLAGHLATITISGVYPRYAEFLDERGSILRKRLPIAPGGVMIWEAYRAASGP